MTDTILIHKRINRYRDRAINPTMCGAFDERTSWLWTYVSCPDCLKYKEMHGTKRKQIIDLQPKVKTEAPEANMEKLRFWWHNKAK